MVYSFEVGDIIFQDIGCGPTCDAINGVTPGYRGAEINHCGIVVQGGVSPLIVEAINPSVNQREIQEFLNRAVDPAGRPRVMVGRIDVSLQRLLDEALAFCRLRIGAPYDQFYLDDPGALYCSELIVDAFAYANGGVKVFPEYPMSFRNTETGAIDPFWVRYYSYFGMNVPEGMPGSNPGRLSLDPRIAIVAQLGDLRGAPLNE